MMENIFFPILIITMGVIYQVNNLQAQNLQLNSMLRQLQRNKMPKIIPVPQRMHNTFPTEKDDDYCTRNHKSCLQYNTYYDRIKSLNARRSKTSEQRVCAHNNITGLMNFDNPCDIVLKNCQIRRPLIVRNAFKEAAQAKGTYYYNGQIKPCLYYLKRTNTQEQAIKLYYADALDVKKIKIT